MTVEEIRSCYPGPDEIEQWIAEIWQKAESVPVQVEVLPDDGFRGTGAFHLSPYNRTVRFSPEGLPPFYAIWQPVHSGPAPLVVHLPGYGAEISSHPDMAAQGYNVLCLSPLGYWTPNGFDTSKLEGDHWPVLPDTLRSGAEHGYKDWLTECVIAVRWAWEQAQTIADRVSFYGTSQGGGTALLLGSVFAGRGVRCVTADLPFLTNYPAAAFRGAYHVCEDAYNAAADKAAAWHALGFADTMSHAARMHYPVLLTEGGADDTCPPDTIEPLYELLPDVKAKMFIPGRVHGYTRESINLTFAWFRLYA